MAVLALDMVVLYGSSCCVAMTAKRHIEAAVLVLVLYIFFVVVLFSRHCRIKYFMW